MNETIKDYINEFKKHYRYSPTQLGKIERIENYLKGLQGRIEYLERSNNRREDTILGLREEIVELATELDKLRGEKNEH